MIGGFIFTIIFIIALIAIGPLLLLIGINYGLSEWITAVPKITYWQAFFVSFLLVLAKFAVFKK
jgi:hypothetical protein